MTLRPEWTHADEVVRIGADWLRSPQPDGSLLTHLGLSTHAGGGLTIRFAPRGRLSGPHAGPGPDCVVIFELPRWTPGTYDPDDFGTYDAAESYPPFTGEEVAALHGLVEAAGLTVVDSWNGAGTRTASAAVSDAQVAPTLRAAVTRYLDACPVHHSVFCGPGAHDPAEEACTWFTASRDRLVEPAWPDVPLPAPPAPPAPADDDRNLDAVRRALERILPVLTEMGVWPATVVAGRRGHIDESGGRLAFVADAGHGVLIPAETAVRLVEAAWLASELGADGPATSPLTRG